MSKQISNARLQQLRDQYDRRECLVPPNPHRELDDVASALQELIERRAAPGAEAAAPAAQPEVAVTFVQSTGAAEFLTDDGRRFCAVEPLAAAQPEAQKQPAPNQNWCVGCSPDNCFGCETEPARPESDPWHAAVLSACMSIESAYQESNPARTIQQLIDWHRSDAVADTLVEAPAVPAESVSLGCHIDKLAAQHGSLRAAARVLEVDPGYLARLRSGEKDDPGETLLRRMGLRRVVTYTTAAAPTAPAVQVNAQMLEALQALDLLFAPLAKDSIQSVWIDKARAAIDAARAKEGGDHV